MYADLLQQELISMKLELERYKAVHKHLLHEFGLPPDCTIEQLETHIRYINLHRAELLIAKYKRSIELL